MKHLEIANLLEKMAPLSFQESYDNSGWQSGHPEDECTGILVCLDVTEAIVSEAIQLGLNLIISHHPLIFKGLKKITGADYVQRTVLLAIQNNISIYSVHTNLDNIRQGVSFQMASLLQLKETKPLRPLRDKLFKIITFIPLQHQKEVLDAMFAQGAGTIGNYDQCSFTGEGTGTFRAGSSARPFVGKPGERHYETEKKTEVIAPQHRLNAIIKALKDAHPYEEAAFDVLKLENSWDTHGAGAIGILEKPVELNTFMQSLCSAFGCKAVKLTQKVSDTISKVALCGGSGSFLLPDAMHAGADIFVTSDIKYHQFFEAEQRIVIVDIGHYESERCTINLLFDVLTDNFTTFAVRKTEINTNPVNTFLYV